jgi:DnaJ-class molecular chaperone
MTSNSPEVSSDENWYHAPEDDTMRVCPQCDGLGCDNWDEEKFCERCMGEGEIPLA